MGILEKLAKIHSKNCLSKLAPIVAVMLLKRWHLAAVQQHLSGKRDGCFLVVYRFASKKPALKLRDLFLVF